MANAAFDGLSRVIGSCGGGGGGSAPALIAGAPNGQLAPAAGRDQVQEAIVHVYDFLVTVRRAAARKLRAACLVKSAATSERADGQREPKSFGNDL